MQVAFCSDVELLRRLLGLKWGVRDEGQAFLEVGEELEDVKPVDGSGRGMRRGSQEMLHPGLDAAFAHVEKLEQNMLRKGAEQ